MFNLGRYLEQGQLIAKNFNKAARYYRMASLANHSYAQYCLANFYALGLGVEKNIASAFSLYEKAAHQKMPWADFCLGAFFEKGYFKKIDPSRAFYYYEKVGSYEIAGGCSCGNGRGKIENFNCQILYRETKLMAHCPTLPTSDLADALRYLYYYYLLRSKNIGLISPPHQSLLILQTTRQLNLNFLANAFAEAISKGIVFHKRKSESYKKLTSHNRYALTALSLLFDGKQCPQNQREAPLLIHFDNR